MLCMEDGTERKDILTKFGKCDFQGKDVAMSYLNLCLSTEDKNVIIEL